MQNRESFFDIQLFSVGVHSPKNSKKERVNTLSYIIIYSILTVKPGFAGQIHAQALKGPLIHIGQNHGRMDLTTTELIQLLHSLFRLGIGGCADRKGDQHLIGMQSGLRLPK